ncbi:MAG: CRISPR-associated endonuclease Cas1 [Magnetococcales bacterium]|nr:CRISPR-associated endonuclease Cas1 [Magnetococcales bacterium]
MPSLYVTEQGATVRHAGASLQVTLDADVAGGQAAATTRSILLGVASHRLEMVGLVGRVHITANATHLCLEQGIGVAWFGWNGRFLGRLVPALAKSGDLRMAQYRCAMDPVAAMGIARRIVAGKCANAVAVLRGIQANYPGLDSVAEAMREINGADERIVACQEAEQLLGIEGNAARAYFGAFGEGFRGEIGFTGRQRRPPPDPANALLSFGYVLLGNLIGGTLEARGLDPAVGFFHALRPGRPSLALDLLEEFRHPVVDRFVLRVVNLRIVRPEMFEADPEAAGGVRLTRAGLKVFFRAWGEYLERPIPEVIDEGGGEESDEEGDRVKRATPATLIRRQVDRLAAALRSGGAYQPFLLRG